MASAAEYAMLTERCGLVNRSERGKLALSGAGAVEFLNGQVTNELVGLTPGEGRYAAFLTHKGKMLGDLRILAVGDDRESAPIELLLDTERIALQALFDMIRNFKVGYEVELHKRTVECSLISLVGPGANEIAGRAFGPSPAFRVGPGTSHPGRSDASTSDPDTSGLDTSGLDTPGLDTLGLDTPGLDTPGPESEPESRAEREHDHLLLTLGRTPVRLIRTDVGLDALFDSSAIETVRSILVQAGAVEVSEATAEIVRVEHGRPRYGVDLDESTIPQEAGLNERAVSFTKGCYVGQETVARLYYRGKPNRHLRGVRLSEPVEPGVELRLGERAVGHLGSSVLSPAFGPIGLALVRREAEPGATVSVGEQGVEAVVVELPFR
jgi:folate-binding protein YgfZ